MSADFHTSGGIEWMNVNAQQAESAASYICILSLVTAVCDTHPPSILVPSDVNLHIQ